MLNLTTTRSTYLRPHPLLLLLLGTTLHAAARSNDQQVTHANHSIVINQLVNHGALNLPAPSSPGSSLASPQPKANPAKIIDKLQQLHQTDQTSDITITQGLSLYIPLDGTYKPCNDMEQPPRHKLQDCIDRFLRLPSAKQAPPTPPLANPSQPKPQLPDSKEDDSDNDSKEKDSQQPQQLRKVHYQQTPPMPRLANPSQPKPLLPDSKEDDSDNDSKEKDSPQPQQLRNVSHSQLDNLRPDTKADDSTADSPLLLLQGNSGAGKSLFGRYLVAQQWQQKPRHYLPLFISLPRYYTASDRDLIAKVLAANGFAPHEITWLRTQPMLLIFDGFDEIRTHYESAGQHMPSNFYTRMQLRQWPHARSIVTCRSQILSDEDSTHQFQVDGQLTQLHIAPFSRHHITQYITLFALSPYNTIEWTYQQYQHNLQRYPSLYDMLTEPFSLLLTLRALPQLKQTQPQGKHITRYDIYTAFTQAWFAHELTKLSEQQNITPTKRKAIRHGFLRYSHALACHMWHLQTQVAIKPSEQLYGQDHKVWRTFFEDSNQVNLQHSPLRRIGTNRYSFIHKSYQEFFVADCIYRSLVLPQTPCTAQHAWNQASIHTEHAILDFLWDKLTPQQARYFQQTILQSRRTPTIAQAAGNSLYLLLYKHPTYCYGRDLSSIHIHHAHLDGHNLASANLSRSTWTDCSMHGVNLTSSNLTAATLHNVDFGQYASLQLIPDQDRDSHETIQHITHLGGPHIRITTTHQVYSYHYLTGQLTPGTVPILDQQGNTLDHWHTLAQHQQDRTWVTFDLRKPQPQLRCRIDHVQYYKQDGPIFIIKDAEKYEQGTLRLYHIPTGQPIGKPIPDVVGWKLSNNILAIKDTLWYVKGTLQLYHATTGKPFGKPIPHVENIDNHYAVADPILAIKDTKHDHKGTLQLYHATTGKPFGKPIPHVENIDDHYAVAGPILVIKDTKHDTKGTLQLYHTTIGKPIGKPISNVVYWQLSHPILVIKDTAHDKQGRLQLYAATTGKPIGKSISNVVYWQLDGYILATKDTGSNTKGILQLYHIPTGDPIGKPIPHVVDWQLKNNILAIKDTSYHKKGTLQLYHTTTAKPIGKPIPDVKYIYDHYAVAGPILAIKDTEWKQKGTLQLYHIPTGEPIGKPIPHVVYWRLADAIIAIEDTKDILQLYHTPTAQPIGKPIPHVVGWQLSDPILAIKDTKGTLQLYHATTAKPIGKPIPHVVCYTLDGNILVIKDTEWKQKGTLQLYHTTTAQPIGKPIPNVLYYQLTDAILAIKDTSESNPGIWQFFTIQDSDIQHKLTLHSHKCHWQAQQVSIDAGMTARYGRLGQTQRIVQQYQYHHGLRQLIILYANYTLQLVTCQQALIPHKVWLQRSHIAKFTWLPNVYQQHHLLLCHTLQATIELITWQQTTASITVWPTTIPYVQHYALHSQCHYIVTKDTRNQKLGNLRLWQLHFDTQRIMEVTFAQPHYAQQVYHIGWLPDRLCLIASSKRVLLHYHLTRQQWHTHKLATEVYHMQSWVQPAYLATVDTYHQIILWQQHADTLQQITTLSHHTHPIVQLRWITTAQQQLLLSASTTTLSLRRIQQQQPLHMGIQGYPDHALYAHNDLLWVRSSTICYRLDPTIGKSSMPPIPHVGDWQRAGHILAIKDTAKREPGTLQRYDIITSKPIGKPIPHVVDWKLTDKILAIRDAYWHDKGTLQLYHTTTGKPIGKPIPDVTYMSNHYAVADNILAIKYAATYHQGTLQLYHIPTAEPIGKPIPHVKDINDYYTADKIFAIKDTAKREQGTLQLYHTITGKPIGKPISNVVDYQLADSILAIKDTPRQSKGTLQLYHTTTGKPIGKPISNVVDWRLDAHILAIKDTAKREQGTLQLYHTITGKPIGKPIPNVVHWRLDGNTLVIRDTRKYDKGTLQLYATTTAQPIGKPIPDVVDYQLIDPILAIKDTGEYDKGRLQLYDITTGKPIGKPISNVLDWRLDRNILVIKDTGAYEQGTLQLYATTTAQPISKPISNVEYYKLTDPILAIKDTGECDKGRLQLYDITTGKPIGKPISNVLDYKIANNILCTSDTSWSQVGTLRCYAIPSGKCISGTIPDVKKYYLAPNSKQLYVIHGNGISTMHDLTQAGAILWRTGTPALAVQGLQIDKATMSLVNAQLLLQQGAIGKPRILAPKPPLQPDGQAQKQDILQPATASQTKPAPTKLHSSTSPQNAQPSKPPLFQWFAKLLSPRQSTIYKPKAPTPSPLQPDGQEQKQDIVQPATALQTKPVSTKLQPTPVSIQPTSLLPTQPSNPPLQQWFAQHKLSKYYPQCNELLELEGSLDDFLDCAWDDIVDDCQPIFDTMKKTVKKRMQRAFLQTQQTHHAQQ